MTSEKKDFYGKEVADAIQKACDELQVPQEQLEIEVVETGSTGIFGLIRKKAHIKAVVKGPEAAETEPELEVASEATVKQPLADEPTETDEEQIVSQETPSEEQEDNLDSLEDNADEVTEISPLDNGEVDDAESEEELSAEALEIIRAELNELLTLMGYASPVEVSSKGSSVFCHVGDEYQDILTGQDGKTLDSIQYLLRKIIARKVPNRLRLTVDVGNYREKRLEELKVRAAELAEKVKATGKTQVISALSPSERRVIHMSLQDDTEIRSRSVGDGLFKKILIYKPGKGSKSGGRKRNNSRGRRGSNSRKR